MNSVVFRYQMPSKQKCLALQRVCGKYFLSYARVERWVNGLKNDRAGVEDNQRARWATCIIATYNIN